MGARPMEEWVTLEGEELLTVEMEGLGALMEGMGKMEKVEMEEMALE